MAQAAHGVHSLTGMYVVNFANYFDIAANPNVALDSRPLKRLLSTVIQ